MYTRLGLCTCCLNRRYYIGRIFMYMDATYSTYEQWLLGVMEKNILKAVDCLAISKIVMVFLRLSKDLKRSPDLASVIFPK